MTITGYSRTEQQLQHTYSDKAWQIFACPECGGPLAADDYGAHCLKCWLIYGRAESGALDLRLTHKKPVWLEFELGSNPLPDYNVNFEPLAINPHPEVDFTGVELPRNLSAKMSSYLPKAKSDDSMMLDLGCGDPIYRQIAEHAGYEYVGLDFTSDKAPLLGDAQALPFLNESFDLIWSNAVFQYIPNPYAMISEAARVLKPGGTFMGTVGFMEPFDGDSFNMYTRLGLLRLLHFGGFKVLRIAPDTWWTGLVAMSRMGLFPRMPEAIARTLVTPLETMSKMWWRLGARRAGSASEANRLSRVTGGHQFIAIKE